MRQLHALFVDDAVTLRTQYIENLRLALRDCCEIDLTFETANLIEQGKALLPRGQSHFGLVVVDLLWKPVGAGRYPLDPRGLEVIEQAARTDGVVIAAVTVGHTRYFPELEQDARAKGAHVFRLLGALQAVSRSGGWEGWASDIADAVDQVHGGQGLVGSRAPFGRPRSNRQSVFVVSGRDRRIADVHRFLRAVGLVSREWPQLVAQATRAGEGGNPHAFDAIRIGFRLAYGAIVVLSPDDEVRLRVDCAAASGPSSDSHVRRQPRPNVLLEAGYALCHARDRTLIVMVGDVSVPSDLAGMDIPRLDNTVASRKRLADRLRAMGFAIDLEADDWLTTGNFEAE